MNATRPTDDQRSSDREVGFRWALPIGIVALCLLFFQGCENNRIQLTVGPLAPFAEIDYDEELPFDSDLTYFSVPRLAFNFVGLGFLLVILPWYSRRVRGVLASPEVRVAILIVAIVFNSILYLHPLWVNAVFWPTCNVTDVLESVFGSPTTQSGERWMMASASRLYFLICWSAVTLLLWVSKWVARRYVFVDPNRWWQFNLQSFLLATFIVGTGLGMLLRLWR